MRTVGVFIDSQNSRGRELLRGIGNFIHRQPDWFVTLHDRTPGDLLNCSVRITQYDGILASIETADDMQLLQRLDVPVVDVCGRFQCARIPRVIVDQQRAGTLAYAHLVGCGFPNLAFYSLAADSSSNHRLDAILHCAQKDGKHINVFRDDSTAAPAGCGGSINESAHSEPQLEKWLTSLPKPIGIIACDDAMGKRLLEACRRCGVQVPAAVAVIGFGSDDVFRAFCKPALSSVPIPNERIGNEAAELLSKLMDGKMAVRHETLVSPATVAARYSTEGWGTTDQCVLMALKFIRENACKGINTEDSAQRVHCRAGTAR
ncbi:MAG: substrate-binding domain-containing protein [Phycisphaerae bacterium]